MGLQHVEYVPTSFADATQPRYLGDPAVVKDLLARFLSQCEQDLADLGAGRLAGPAFEAATGARIRELAAVFSGTDGRYLSIAGFHGHSLPAHLIAALGPFWRARRAYWAGDAVAVLLEWLVLQLTQAWKTADGDDLVFGVALRPALEQASALLLGSENRA